MSSELQSGEKLYGGFESQVYSQVNIHQYLVSGGIIFRWGSLPRFARINISMRVNT